jgi:peptidoglycan/LPS O-acetylase OafA/YrhL
MSASNSFEERLRRILPLVVSVVILFAGAAAFLVYSPSETNAQDNASAAQNEAVVIPGEATIVAPAAEVELVSNTKPLE